MLPLCKIKMAHIELLGHSGIRNRGSKTASNFFQVLETEQRGSPEDHVSGNGRDGRDDPANDDVCVHRKSGRANLPCAGPGVRHDSGHRRFRAHGRSTGMSEFTLMCFLDFERVPWLGWVV